MNIPFRQTSISGCAYFCLANLLNDKRYIHDVEGLTRGQGSFVTNERLMKFYPTWYIETEFCLRQSLNDFPTRLTDPSFFNLKWDLIPEDAKEFCVTPYLVTIARPGKSPHAILAMHNWKDDWMYIFDSKVENRTYCDLQAFVDGYLVIQIESFHSLDLEPEIRDYPIALDKRDLPHLFEPGE